MTLAYPKTGLEAVDVDHLLADIGLPADVYEQFGIPPSEFLTYVVDFLSA